MVAIKVGDRIEVRGDGDWRAGVVMGQKINGKWEVQLDGWDKACTWPQLRLPDSEIVLSSDGLAPEETQQAQRNGAEESEPAMESDETRPEAAAQGTIIKTSLKAYKKKCEVVYAPGHEPKENQDSDDDDIFAPGVSEYMGGKHGGKDVCWQGARCKNKRCRYWHPPVKSEEPSKSNASAPAQAEAEPAEATGPAAMSEAPADAGSSSSWKAANAWPKGAAPRNPWEAAWQMAQMAWEWQAQTDDGVDQSMQDPQDLQENAEWQGEDEQAEDEEAELAQEAVPEEAVEQEASDDPATNHPAVSRSEQTDADARAAGVADQADKRKAVAPGNEKPEEELKLEKENKKLRTRLEIAELKAENAELKLKELQKKYDDLEALEKQLLASSGGWVPPKATDKSGPAAAERRATGGKGGKSGRGVKRKGNEEGDGDDAEKSAGGMEDMFRAMAMMCGKKGGGKKKQKCKGFAKGNCKWGDECYYSHD